MVETLERMQERARELARSGKFSGWRSVAFELQFEPGLKEVFQWRHSAPAEDAFLWLHSSMRKKNLTAFVLSAFVPKLGTPKLPDGLQLCGDAARGQGNSFATPRPSRTGRCGR
jgi:hypothetical protein